ncbi:MAG TPA: Ku protein [bacterium]
MAPGAIWKGEIRFGQASVPVKLHAAVREERIEFHLLHKRDRVRLRQQMICSAEDAPVPAAEQVKGFEVEENRYILVDPEELERTAPEGSRAIEVHEFVKAAQIDPLFFDRAYHLEPDAGPQAYGALRAALAEQDLAGVCTWTMRKRSYLGALRAAGGTLRLHTLRHADEIVPAKALDLPALPLSEKELKIAVELIGHLAASFDAAKFRDEHEERLRGLIARKARGEKVAVVPPRRLKPTPDAQLLKALEASLKKVA